MHRSESSPSTLKRLLAASIVFLGLNACHQKPEAPDRLNIARAEIAKLGVELGSVKADLDRTRSELVLQRLRADPYKTATFDPAADEGFSRLDTSIGSFTVSIQDVQPYADGVRVRLDVGNLTAADVAGAVLDVRWGKREPKSEEENFLTKYDAWSQTLREKQVTLNEDLRSGQWNKVTLTLPGTPPQEFGYLQLSMETPRIKLRVPR